MAAKQETDVVNKACVDHPLTQEEIEKRASSETPLFKMAVEVKGKKELHTCYFHTENQSLHYLPDRKHKNLSTVLKISRLVKQGESDQHGYTISNVILEDTYLQVTDQSTGSKKRAAKFTDPKEAESRVFHQNQLFKLKKHPNAETKFALYTTVVNSKGHNKLYYLKLESGTIVAEESSTPDGYYYFSMIQACDDEGPYPVLRVATRPNGRPTLFCYISTGRQYLLYNPSTFTGTVASNQSVRLNLNPIQGGFFTISSYVIPSLRLEIELIDGNPDQPQVVFGPEDSTNPLQRFTVSPALPSLVFSLSVTVTTPSIRTYYLVPSNDTDQRIIAQEATGAPSGEFRFFNVTLITDMMDILPAALSHMTTSSKELTEQTESGGSQPTNETSQENA